MAAAKVGETLTVTDELDANVVEVTVTRVRVPRGGEFDKPDHGRYLLATVKVKALANDVTTPTLYVLVGSEKYDQTIALLDAGAYYETYKSLSTGQTHQGLAVFDAPPATGGSCSPATTPPRSGTGPTEPVGGRGSEAGGWKRPGAGTGAGRAARQRPRPAGEGIGRTRTGAGSRPRRGRSRPRDRHSHGIATCNSGDHKEAAHDISSRS